MNNPDNGNVTIVVNASLDAAQIESVKSMLFEMCEHIKTARSLADEVAAACRDIRLEVNI